jgi:four helix bundle protein
MRENVVKTKSFEFAIKIVDLYRILTTEHKEYVMSKQLLRSGTAIGALVRESQNAESSKDFIHKMGIAQKECDESLYWLELLQTTKYINGSDFKLISSLANDLLKIIRSVILTSKSKLK